MLREQQNVKQITVALALNMQLPNYCKLENGARGITAGQLDIISRVFNTTPVQLLLLSQDFSNKEYKPKSLTRSDDSRFHDSIRSRPRFKLFFR